MKIQAYVSFNGRCEDALEFYKTSLGAQVTGLVRWKDHPDQGMKMPLGYAEKIMNVAFRSLMPIRRRSLENIKS